jgi:ribosomal-protein-alanine N-acetyltransferase
MIDANDLPPVLEGSRVVLRPLRHDDADGLHEAYGDPEAMRFWDFAPSRNMAETAERIGRSLQASAAWHCCWAVVLKDDLVKDEARFVGMVNYHHREPWNHRLEVGYILARAHWRRGLMQDAMTALLSHCFGALACHRVEAVIEPANLSSIALVQRLGFQGEGGPMRGRLCVEGAFRDTLMFGLLADDWRARAL